MILVYQVLEKINQQSQQFSAAEVVIYTLINFNYTRNTTQIHRECETKLRTGQRKYHCKQIILSGNVLNSNA